MAVLRAAVAVDLAVVAELDLHPSLAAGRDGAVPVLHGFLFLLVKTWHARCVARKRMAEKSRFLSAVASVGYFPYSPPMHEGAVLKSTPFWS